MSTVHGNLSGLKPDQLHRLGKTYRRRVSAHEVLSAELAAYLTGLSHEIKRQIGVLISRGGVVEDVFVGDERGVVIPDLSRYRLGRTALRGVRMVHTHLRNEALNQDDLTDLALLRFDLIAALGVDAGGRPGTMYLAHVLPPNPDNRVYEVWAPTSFHALDLHLSTFLHSLDEEFSRLRSNHHVNQDADRAILISVSEKHRVVQEESVTELRELAASDGIVVLDTVIQRLQTVHPKYLLGQGKLKDVVISALHRGADFLIFDQNLTPGQTKAISEITEMKVIDRTQLILDIFSRRAHSREGKLQVELAQLRYTLPRLADRSTALSRLTGGIGGRGPGETKLELDRRRIRDRIALLERQQKTLVKQRHQQRALRTRHNYPVVALVGYTNAGKSTLLNALTHNHCETSNQVFTTLDTASRRLRLLTGKEVVLTDTVGFIQKLPKGLMGAFQTTLDELNDADLLLHVCDLSSPTLDDQLRVVSSVLSELSLTHIPRLLVLNKSDRVDSTQRDTLAYRLSGIAISALNTASLPPLLEAIDNHLQTCAVDALALQNT
ncbi:MAG TPA: GTPase HflX [Nitrospirales bacterium]|nr:GTPase HflX [Nitrospirales bacterium]HIB53533.1 GTPase HflX [Nitrospirales bacterium]HIO22078.1 GTPase HflX [Nitrospirales bacterium]